MYTSVYIYIYICAYMYVYLSLSLSLSPYIYIYMYVYMWFQMMCVFASSNGGALTLYAKQYPLNPLCMSPSPNGASERGDPEKKLPLSDETKHVYSGGTSCLTHVFFKRSEQ